MSDVAWNSNEPSARNWLSTAAGLCLPRPRLTVAVAVIVLVVLGILALGLPINTSRHLLVDEDDEYQSKLVHFYEKYGFPDSLLVVVKGGDAAARRDLVDRLSARLNKEPLFAGKVLGRIGLEQVAELLLLLQPDVLTELRARVDEEPAAFIEGGVDRWIDALEAQLSEGLEADEPSVDEDQADGGLRALAALLRAFEAQLAGADPTAELAQLIPDDQTDGELAVPMNVDERGYLVSADGETHIVGLFADMPSTESVKVKPIVDRLRAIRDELVEGTGLSVAFTGVPALESDELVSVERGLAVTSVATSAGIVLLLLLAFRSLRYTLLALLPLGVGLVMTMAVVRLTYGSLNLLTSSFVSMLMALGIDFGVYVLSRYGEQVRAGATTRDAIVGAVAKAGPGVSMGAATTIMAFSMTTTTDFTAFAELGAITGIGLTLMLAVTFVLLPPLVVLAGRGKAIQSPEIVGLQHLSPAIRKVRYILPALALGTAVWCLANVGSLRFNPRYFDFMPEDMESVQALAVIERDIALTPVQAGVDVGDVEKTRQLAAELRQLEVVGAVLTATDLLPALDEREMASLRAGFANLARQPDFDALWQRERAADESADKVDALVDVLDEVAFAIRQSGRDTAAIAEARTAAIALRERLRTLKDAQALTRVERRAADLLERAWKTARAVAERGHYVALDLPPIFRHRFVSRDGQSLALYVNPKGDPWDPDTARDFTREVTRLAPQAAGVAVSVHVHMQMIVGGFTRAAMFSAGLVLIILLVGFRKLHDALFAMVPVVLGLSWLLGTMVLIDMPFDVVNIVVPTLIFGIGIDAGAHLMHRWRESANRHGGVARLDEVIRGTGAAVLMASLTTATGFATLMLAENNGMSILGLSMTIGIAASLVGALFVLPALLVLLGKAR